MNIDFRVKDKKRTWSKLRAPFKKYRSTTLLETKRKELEELQTEVTELEL